MTPSRDEHVAADAAARRLARREFVRPVVLEAGAGTGKTTALVARILAWSLGPGWQRHAARGGERAPLAVAQDVLGGVVAITFTERAAVEMEERAARDLGELHGGGELAGLPRGEIALDDETLRRRVQALLEALDHLRVSTIHGWCARLLGEHALAAGLPLSQTVDADGEQARAAARAAVTESLESRWGAQGDPDCVTLAELGHGPRALAEALEILITEGVREQHLAGDPYPEALVSERGARLCAELAAFARAFGTAFATGRVSKARQTILACEAIAARLASARGDEFLDPQGLSAFDSEAHERLAEWARGKFTTSEADALGPTLAGECARRARELVLGLATFARARPESLRPARRVLATLLRRARAGLAERGMLSFHELLEHARDLLEHSPAVRGAVRSSIDQLLVDEFQDTDATQCAIVAALAFGGEPGSPSPGLFLVGDPKQSIYAWRGADLLAYEQFVGACLERGGVRGLLCVNFRSSQALLDEVERLVSGALVHVSGLQAPFQPLIAGQALIAGGASRAAAGEPPPAVEHWSSSAAGESLSADRARTREARALATELCAAHERGTPWKEMALLLRSTTQQEVYLGALRERGIPVVVEKDRSFYRTREVIDALSLVSAVLDPVDLLSLAAALRSSPVGVPDAALAPLWSAGFPAAAASLGRGNPAQRALALAVAEKAIGRAAERAPAVPELPDWALAAVELARGLDALRAGFAELALERWVALLRARFPFEELEAARYLGAFRLANLERFFELLERGLAEHPGGIPGLLRSLREGAEGRRERAAAPPGDEDLDALRVLSVHKAKGLEYELVALADVHHRDPPEHSREPVRVRAFRGGLALELLGVPDLDWQAAGERSDAVAAHETARLLYVAATRAKHRLIVAGSHGTVRDATVLHRLVLDRLGHVFQDPRLAEPGASCVDHHGVRYRTLADGSAETGARDAAPVPVVDPSGALAAAPAAAAAAAEADGARLARARAAAAAHSSRPLVGSVSALASLGRPTRFGAAPSSDADAGRARALGTAIHRLLESLDPARPLGAQIPALVRREGACLERDPRAAREFSELVDSVAFRRALERLLPCLARALGRELPLVVPAASDAATLGPVAAQAGALDLLYRDPNGRLVVADYKTDRVADAAAALERAQEYRPQLAAYAQAVEAALGEAPRQELWFVRAGEVVTLE